MKSLSNMPHGVHNKVFDKEEVCYEVETDSASVGKIASCCPSIISASTVHKVLRQSLNVYPYKFSLGQALPEHCKANNGFHFE